MTKQPKRRVQLDQSGQTVRANVARLRARNGFTLADLAMAMHAVGHPMGFATVSEIEHGARRVDVDDLTALAFALDVSPAVLLMPYSDDPTAVTAGVTGLPPTSHAETWVQLTRPDNKQKDETDG